MDYPALLAVLQQHANPERAVPMQAYMKHRFNYFGIGKPELARLCRPFFKDAAKQPVDWNFVRRCWDNPHRELQYAALEYLKKNAAAPDPAGHSAFADADYRKIMVGQLRRIRPHCRRHCPAPPRSQHRPIGMEHRRQHLAAPRHHRPPTAPRTAPRHRAAGKIICNNLGQKEFFINKAIGWALRDYSKTIPAWVQGFIDRYRYKMAKLSLREAGKYLPREAV